MKKRDRKYIVLGLLFWWLYRAGFLKAREEGKVPEGVVPITPPVLEASFVERGGISIPASLDMVTDKVVPPSPSEVLAPVVEDLPLDSGKGKPLVNDVGNPLLQGTPERVPLPVAVSKEDVPRFDLGCPKGQVSYNGGCYGNDLFPYVKNLHGLDRWF